MNVKVELLNKVNEFMRLVCKFLNDCSDKVKTGDKATNARVIADSRTGYFSFTGADSNDSFEND